MYRNGYQNTDQGSLRNSAVSNLKSGSKEKELDIIHKGAGGGWCRGRGRFDNSKVQASQSTAVMSYAQNLGRNYSSSSVIYTTSASGLNLSLEKQCTVNVSGNSWSRQGTRNEGSWRNSDTRSASSAGSWQNSATSRASTAWMPSRPISSASYGQQSYGRGQYVPSASSVGSWQNSATSSVSTTWMLSQPISSASYGQQQSYDREQYAPYASSVGSWQNSATNNASTAWMPSRPISSASNGQQSYGRGQYVPSTKSWNTRTRHRNSE